MNDDTTRPDDAVSVDGPRTAPAPAGTATAPRPRSRFAGLSGLVVPAILVALGVFLIVGILDMEIADDSELFGPKAFPILTAVPCFVVAVLLAITVIRNPEEPEGELDEDGTLGQTVTNWRCTLITIGGFVLFAVLLIPAGWIIAGALAFWCVTVGLGSTRYLFNLLIGLALSSIVQLVFGGLLGLNLPAGIMGVF